MNQSSPYSHTAGYVGSKMGSPEAATPFKPLILWIDGVGGYLLIDRDSILIGQAGSMVDIAVVGDISRQAAVIRRRDVDYFVEPLQETRVDDQPVSSLSLLGNQSQMQFGSRVTMRLVKPHPLSSSARLEMVSLHRFQPRVDGVVLLADSCILGPGSSSHVRCPEWDRDLLLFKQESQWFFKILGNIDANRKIEHGQVAITAGLRLRGADFSLSIE